ncbi:DUF4411 family protein [Flavihumibacter sp. UBA7668]|uniref:DUF4411 family protein n=1 Tax=Flavihumibacter sp. UBA7668 TaxID=1946542 RepID=UPI0025B8A26D|nr:DUF4411 family protein [Flavihumibacter sp. UBA7668]
MAGQLFIIDTSCLIQAHRIYYPFDIAPSFWDFMKLHFSRGTFILTNKVEDEIGKGKDELANWIHAQLPASIAVDCHADTNIMAHYGNIMVWGNNHPQYAPLAKRTFSDFENADPFIVATAIQKSAIVISQEISAPTSQKAIKLPDVCSNFNVTHNDTFALLRRFGFTM